MFPLLDAEAAVGGSCYKKSINILGKLINILLVI